MRKSLSKRNTRKKGKTRSITRTPNKKNKRRTKYLKKGQTKRKRTMKGGQCNAKKIKSLKKQYTKKKKEQISIDKELDSLYDEYIKCNPPTPRSNRRHLAEEDKSEYRGVSEKPTVFGTIRENVSAALRVLNPNAEQRDEDASTIRAQRGQNGATHDARVENAIAESDQQNREANRG